MELSQEVDRLRKRRSESGGGRRGHSCCRGAALASPEVALVLEMIEEADSKGHVLKRIYSELKEMRSTVVWEEQEECERKVDEMQARF